jgi:hypothetical protein
MIMSTPVVQIKSEWIHVSINECLQASAKLAQ